MQQYDSHLPSSPMNRFPSLLGLSYWPFIPYPPAPSMPLFNIVIEPQGEPAVPIPAKATCSSQILDRPVWNTPYPLTPPSG